MPKLKSDWVVELHPGCWLAPWPGDPGRTCDISAAKRYRSPGSARRALGQARRHRKLRDARVVRDPQAPGVIAARRTLGDPL